MMTTVQYLSYIIHFSNGWLLTNWEENFTQGIPLDVKHENVEILKIQIKIEPLPDSAYSTLSLTPLKVLVNWHTMELSILLWWNHIL